MKKIGIIIVFLVSFFIGLNSIMAKDEYVKINYDGTTQYPDDIGGDMYACKYSFNFNNRYYELFIFANKNGNKYNYRNGAMLLNEFNSDISKKISSNNISNQFNRNLANSILIKCPEVVYNTKFMTSADKFQFFNTKEQQLGIGVDSRDYKLAISDDENNGICYTSEKNNEAIWIDIEIGPAHYDLPSDAKKINATTKTACLNEVNQFISTEEKKGVCYSYKEKSDYLWVKKDADITKHPDYNELELIQVDTKTKCKKWSKYSNIKDKGKCYIYYTSSDASIPDSWLWIKEDYVLIYDDDFKK